ncbi:MAG TPA: sigma-70 family RNA polymerase sigma factor [Nannocystis sp.]|jgi:RNA polymerase sigma-70 factor (ECF subfamily)
MDSHPHLTVPARADLGDLAAFGRLYRDTAGLVRRSLARLGVIEAALDDATQDVFITAYRRRDEFDSARPIEPWLLGIARKVAFRYRRTVARGQRKLTALQHVAEAPREQLAAHVEARRFLASFLEELRDERREVFVLGELYGLTGPEIAARLKIPVDTAYTRLRAGRRQLELALLRSADDEPAQTSAALQRGWLLLAPRLGDSSGAGWLLLALGKAKLALGVTAVAATVALVVIPRDAPAPAPAIAPKIAAKPEPPASPTAPARLQAPPQPPDEATPPAPTLTPSRGQAPTRPPSDPLGADRLTAALALLQAGDPAGALAEADRHAREHPTSPLAEARTLTRVRALCALGRDEQARSEATSLDRAGPAGEALAGTCAAP